MKRILCIVSSLNAGGAETLLMKIYRMLPEDIRLDFAVSEDNGIYEKEVEALGGIIHRVPLRTKHPFKVYKGIKNAVKENKYDSVLKLCDTPIGYFDLLAAKAGGATKLCARSCNASSSESALRKIVNTCLRPAFNRITTVKIAPSDLAAEYTFGKAQVEAGNVNFLNNAVDLSVFRYDADARGRIRAEFSLEDKLVVGHIGRFNQQKNHAYLLEIFERIASMRPDARLMLVGKGELEGQIREKAEERGILDKIIFTGVRKDVPALLSAMDVFVFPSFYEGMPNTVIEAQATGLPAVISDTITKQADITGIVDYLPITLSPEEWAKRALIRADAERADTHPDFIKNKYDIQSTAKEFVRLCT